MELWGFEETAKFLKCTPRAVRNKVMRRQIPFRKVAGRIVFIANEIVTWIEKAPGVSVNDCLRGDDR
jgi:hypothetical protein